MKIKQSSVLLMGAILAPPPAIFNTIENDVSYIMMTITQQAKAQEPHGQLYAGKGSATLTILLIG
ncbi:hypothetical protein M9Y53_03610, partial [Klebsiella pneumoniae]|uniref:hypothetical protein n=1 Tax=Klebsiella pneumoniae TaxID=573 RepID=UPI002023881A